MSAGKIIAHDIVENRLKQIRGSLARAGLDGSGAKRVPEIVTVSNATFLELSIADAVLVDAPCSSLGVLRRRPSHRWELSEDAVRQDFPALQYDILKAASLRVKLGGRLVYATCSICKDENEKVAKKFESMEDFDETWERWDFHDGSNYRSILPHVHNCDGFFLARWKRRIRK